MKPDQAPNKNLQNNPENSNIEKRQAISISEQQFKNIQEVFKINEVYNINPDIKQIGSQEQYIKYLETIFPESSTREILYHGTDAEDKIFKEGFDKNISGQNFAPRRYYFTNNKDRAFSGGGRLSNKESKKDILYVILNNPMVVREVKDGHGNNLYTDYGVNEPEEMHILGSNNDIEKFKDFVTKSKS